MNSVNLHNIVDIRILEPNESTSGDIVWRTFEFEDIDGNTTQITAFPDGIGNKVKLDTNLDRDYVDILRKLRKVEGILK